MRRHLPFVIAVLAIISAILVGWSQPTIGQDITPQRVDALETRVAVLETQVAGQPAVSPTPIAGETYTITGTISLRSGDWTYSASSGLDEFCVGKRGYDDMRVGLAVAVLDSTEETIALGRIETSKTTTNSSCVFSFRVENVPDSPIYTFKIGHRGAPVYSKQELEDADWNITLSLG